MQSGLSGNISNVAVDEFEPGCWVVDMVFFLLRVMYDWLDELFMVGDLHEGKMYRLSMQWISYPGQAPHNFWNW